MNTRLNRKLFHIFNKKKYTRYKQKTLKGKKYLSTTYDIRIGLKI